MSHVYQYHINYLAVPSPADHKIDEFCEEFRKELSNQSVAIAAKRKSNTVEVKHVKEAAHRMLIQQRFDASLSDLMIE